MNPMSDINMSQAASNRMDGQIDLLKMMALNRNEAMSEKQMKELANQFESMLFRQVLKEMRKTVPDNGFIEQSHATKMYMDIADDHLAQQLAESNNLGLDQIIVDELKQRNQQAQASNGMQSNEAFMPLAQKQDGSPTPEFIPLHPENNTFIPLPTGSDMMDLQPKQRTFIPLSDHPGLSTDKIQSKPR